MRKFKNLLSVMVGAKNSGNIILLFTVIVAYIGVSMPYPIFPVLLLHKGNNLFLHHSHILSSPLLTLSSLLAVYPLGQVFGNMCVGRLSDIYSRKMLLCITLFLASTCYFISAYAISCHHLLLLLFSRFLTGLFEGNVTIVQSLLTDQSSTTSTAKNFSLIFTCCTFGFMFGPLLGASLSDSSIISWLSYSTPFTIVGALILLVMLCLYYSINDPFLQKEERSTVVGCSLVKQGYHVKSLIWKITIISFVCFFSIDLVFAFLPVYLFSRWGLSSLELSYFSVYLSISLFLTQVIILPILIDKMKTSTMIALSLLTLSLAIITVSLMNHYYFVFLLAPFIAFSIATFTTNINVMITHCSSSNHIGKTLGGFRSIRASGDILACLVFGIIASVQIKLPLLFVSFLLLGSLLFYLVSIREKFESIKGRRKSVSKLDNN